MGLVLALSARGLHADDAFDHERARAELTAQRIEAEWPLADSGEAVKLIRKVTLRLTQAAPPEPGAWRITVIRDRSINAFAIGGYRIYVNEGTVAGAETEAELAAVIAHEMGHQLAGHFREDSSGSPGSFSSGLAKLFGGGGTDESDVSIGSVTQKLDLRKEFEADRISIRLLTDAGYDPHAALSIARRLRGVSASWASHLSNERRIEALEKLLVGVPAGGIQDSDEFRREHARLAVGKR